jgi:malate dehydrogenase (oxaloacetate-decarboxylating)(NADP+)
VRDDAVMATGRSDYPNQVNNVLCFPFIFRGALDVGATTINEAMKLAAVNAIAELAHAEKSDIVAQAYGSQQASFGPEYLIPRPFDPRLIVKIAPAVAKAAMESGVATDPIKDFRAYVDKLNEFVYHSGLIMKPVFTAAKAAPKRVVFTEGEDERILRATQVVVDEGLAKPILIGRPAVVKRRIDRAGLRIKAGKDFDLVNPEDDPRYRDYWMEYHRLMERRGVSTQIAKLEMRRRTTLIGAMMIHKFEADALICGMIGAHASHLEFLDHVVGKRKGVKNYYAMNLLMLPRRTIFICDTYVNVDPTAEQLVEMTQLASEEICRFGLVPKVALVSHSSFGNSDAPSAAKMRVAYQLIRSRMPDLEVEGEMQGDAALSEEIRVRAFPNTTLKGDANLLVMPTLDAANISFNLMKVVGGSGITVGPILLGAARAVHVLTPSATVRRIINMTALAVVDAQQYEASHP